MTDISKDVKVKFLVERRFGNLARFAKTVGDKVGGGGGRIAGFGALFALAAQRYPHDEQTVDMARAYRADLESMDEPAIDRLFGVRFATILAGATSPEEEVRTGATDFDKFNDEFSPLRIFGDGLNFPIGQ